VNKLIDIDFQLRKIDLKYNIEKEVRYLLSETFIAWDFKDKNIVDKVYKIKEQRFIEDKNLEELFDYSKEHSFADENELYSLFQALSSFYMLCEKVIYNASYFRAINSKDMHDDYHSILEDIVEKFDLPSNYFYRLATEKSKELEKESKAVQDISDFPHYPWLNNKIKDYIEKNNDWSPLVSKRNIKNIAKPIVTALDEFGYYSSKEFTGKELEIAEIRKENRVFKKIIGEYATLKSKNGPVSNFNLITLRELVRKENAKEMYDFEISQLIKKDQLKRFLRLFPEFVLDFDLIPSGKIIIEELGEFGRFIKSASPEMSIDKQKIYRFKADNTILRVGHEITYFPQEHIDKLLIVLNDLSIPEENISYDNRGFPVVKI
jgi:hypothetical protein